MAATRPGVRARKRDAITGAARAVFGREGYTRASIDAIAGAAEVSTRTIYNHFPGKEQLFTAVLLESATEVATAVVERAAQAFAGPDEPVEEVLHGLGLALAAQRTDFREHFAMVRLITPEAATFPEGLYEAWQDAGPRRVRGEVVARLTALVDRGVLRIDDPARAALHLVLLTTAELDEPRDRPDPATVDATVRAGVAAFLHGYATR